MKNVIHGGRLSTALAVEFFTSESLSLTRIQFVTTFDRLVIFNPVVCAVDGVQKEYGKLSPV